ncbi:MAG: iron ABC transporter permease, partial [Hyphomicrobiales bacterium]|nr:iron ABC transporter permease [Hyphomicrobiales bacterium]
WFPDIRSLGGAIFVLSCALYPYVYLSARAAFVQQSICALEVARTLGRSQTGALWSVALPMARPALIAGVALALMECLNDIGAVEYLGVQTLTASIYATWLERESLGGAAQIASVMLIIVFALFLAERHSRGDARYYQATGRYRPITFARLAGWRGMLCTVLCSLPLVFGFCVPGAILLSNATSAGWDALDDRFWRAMGHSFEISLLAAIVTVAVGLALAYGQRANVRRLVKSAIGLAGLGYAVPGTILAIGLLIPLAGLDNWLNEVASTLIGVSGGQIFAGTIFTLVLAYAIRFSAISLGALDAGLQRISPSMDAAARTLGEKPMGIVWRIHLPLLLPAIGTAALMVFVDSLKELPATLLLQPFNVETLATFVYGKADAYEFEDAAVAALTIVAIGLLPVLLLHRAVAHGRPGAARGD